MRNVHVDYYSGDWMVNKISIKFSLDLLNMICLAINYIYYEKNIYFRALKFNNFATSQYRDDNVIYTEISTSSKGDKYSLKMASTIQQP